MQLGPTFLVLLCSFIWECIGAPPKDVGEKFNIGSKYRKEEDQFIVDELSNLLDDTVPFYRRALWETLSEKYQEKWKQGFPGFIPERSAQSLLDRFRKVLIHNHPRNKVQVPQDLMEKIMKNNYLQKAERGSKISWTKEENDFIIKELSKPTYTNLFSSSTSEAIRAEHDRKREAGIPGFENVRNKEGIHSHLTKMRREGHIPNEVLEKLETRGQGIREPYNKYENNLIIEVLSKPSVTTLFHSSTLEAIRAAHDKKRAAGAHGFKTVRTAPAISKHLTFMKENGLLPNELLEKLQKHHKGASSSSSKPLPPKGKSLQITSDGSDGWVADMIEELQNTDFDIDFSKFD